MQTLKTAAIVVLLMTVMYGAYVSLTTPPEPLPADVEEMLVASEEDALAIDVGLPASLGQMDFGPEVAFPEQPADVADPIETPPPTGAAMFPPASEYQSTSPVPSFSGDTGDIDEAVTATLSDSVPAEIPAEALAAIPEMSGAVAPTSAPRDYPVTSNTFDLPDPSSVVDQLNSRSAGPGFESPSALALTSGTDDSQPAISAPPSAEELVPAVPGPASTAIGGNESEPGIRMSAGLANAIRVADTQYAEDKRKEALATLSLFYHSPGMTGEDRRALLARLDPLAREVIYSRRHLLEQPYRVGQSETLMEVATRFEVPWQLLANINGVADPVTVLPGTELKVVRGPFRAEVDLTLKELTLFLGDMYAGRFPVGIGSDPPPKPGTFTVQDKQTNRTFYDAAGTPVPPGSRDNPYGSVWLDLGGQLSIHGSPSTTQPTDKGCISLAGDFAEDLYGILSQGSTVTIRR